MNMRFFFMGHRILGIRPGISFGASDLRKAFGTTTTTVRGRGAMTGSFVYVIEGESGHHKIGVSRDPIQRKAELQTGSPVPLRFAYIGVTPGSGYDIEGRAHELLDAHRKEGEWFLVPASIAIGATLEAASRIGQPIQQVAPETVPEIIRMANQPDRNARRGRWYEHWLVWTIISILLFLALLDMFSRALESDRARREMLKAPYSWEQKPAPRP
jgi:hypothetical protein